MQTIYCNTSSLLLQKRVILSYTTHRARAVPGCCKGGPCPLTGCPTNKGRAHWVPVTSDQHLTSLVMNYPCRSGSTKILTKLFISWTKHWAKSSGGLPVLLLILLSLQKQMQTPYLSNASTKLGAVTGPADFCTPAHSWWSVAHQLIATCYGRIFCGVSHTVGETHLQWAVIWGTKVVFCVHKPILQQGSTSLAKQCCWRGHHWCQADRS